MSIELEIKRLAHGYVRKGGTINRRQQVKRMLVFGDFCVQNGARSLGQVGKGHVIRYWRSTRGLDSRTRDGYWYALRILWQLAGKAGEPPRPFIENRADSSG